MNAFSPPLASLPPDGTKGVVPGYTNFPTIHMGSHVLLLRPNWPEDIPTAPTHTGFGSLSAFGSEGDVLTLSDSQGQTVAAIRVKVRLCEPLPDPKTSPWPGVMASLQTALRYSRLGWLETGPASLQTGNAGEVTMRAALLWQGLVRLMERNGLGFALGLSITPPSDADAPVTDMLPALLDKYGLSEEFAYRPTKFAIRTVPAPMAVVDPETALPADLREALRRGARLCGEPQVGSNQGLSFFWVAHRTLLQAGLPRA